MGFCIGRNMGSGDAPQPKQIITDFIYFKTVSLTTSDVYCIARLSCYYFNSVDCVALKHHVPCRSMTAERTARWQKVRWRSQALHRVVKCSRKTPDLRTRVNTARIRANIRVILSSICAHILEKSRSHAHTVHAGLCRRAS